MTFCSCIHSRDYIKEADMRSTLSGRWYTTNIAAAGVDLEGFRPSYLHGAVATTKSIEYLVTSTIDTINVTIP